MPETLQTSENLCQILSDIRKREIPIPSINFDQKQRKPRLSCRKGFSVLTLVPPTRVGLMCPEILVGNGVEEIRKASEQEGR